MKLSLRNAEQSSTYNNHKAPKAYDGILSGFQQNTGGCSETNLDSQPWWRAELGGKSIISLIKIMPRQDCCKEVYTNVKVYSSHALFDHSWVLCRDLGNEMQTSTTWVEIKCSQNRISKYIKVVSGIKRLFPICEIEVWGYTFWE